MADFCNHEKIVHLLEKQAPWWKPGSRSGYHAITQGHLQNEIVQRVTGQSLGAFFKANVAEPLGADFHIGTSEDLLPRIGFLSPPDPRLDMGLAPESVAAKTMNNPAMDAMIPRTVAWRGAEIPAANGHGNARSVARIHSAIACGGEVDGVGGTHGHSFMNKVSLPLIHADSSSRTWTK